MSPFFFDFTVKMLFKINSSMYISSAYIS